MPLVLASFPLDYNYLGGKHVRIIFSLLFLVLVTGCGKNPAEEMQSAIDVALTHLSNDECDDALDALNEVDNESDNAIYLQVLASAHACKAGFDETSFISTDLTNLNTTSFATIMTSLAKLSLSDETEVDSLGYTSIRTAINVLLNSTSGNPSQVDRTTKFGTRKSGDMGVQALILNIVNLGKFLNYYGNVDALGAKGDGSGSNTCFIDYLDNRAQLVINPGNLGGACTTFIDGHPDLSFAAANLSAAKRRLCEGLMLVTNTLDILDNIDLSSSGSLSKLEDISTQVGSIKTTATAAGLGDLINMTSQSECETHLETQANFDDMEYLYALIFESGLQ